MKKNIHVDIANITKIYGKNKVLDDVSLDIKKGEYIVLLGPSGSGKTTLLNMVGGFDFPDTGTVSIGGKDITALSPSKRPTTTVFQDYALFPHMSIGDNIAFGLKMQKVPQHEYEERVQGALEMVSLDEFYNRKVGQLSGGQKQRVALARSLVVNPEVLLLDEPLGALDMNLRRQMQVELLNIHKSIGTTFIHVTHDQEEAMNVANRIVIMNDGVIEDFGSPSEIYLKPKSRFAAEFMGESNFIEASIIDIIDNKLVLSTPFGNLHAQNQGFSKHDAVSICIRPEQFFINVENQSDEIQKLCQVNLNQLSFWGESYEAKTSCLDKSGLHFKIKIPQRHDFRVGDILTLSVNSEDIVVVKD